MHNLKPDNILCPVDFSDLSGHALRYAALLARCLKSNLIAAYANWFDAPPYFTESRVAELQSEFRESFNQADRMLREFTVATLAGEDAPPVQTRVIEALPADGILKLAQTTSAGLIVMGTHGRSGLNRWTLGSVAERVLRESAVPVLTVRSAPPRPIRHILAPVDDSDASRSALSVAAGLAACFDATVTALHVQEPGGRGAIPNLCAWIPAEERSRCLLREVVRHGSPAEEIVRFASENAADLMVVGAPRRRFFEGMVLGTTTLRAVRHAPCPVLSVPAVRAAKLEE
jgi:nucleotide-binding universal stress UspA family protein